MKQSAYRALTRDLAQRIGSLTWVRWQRDEREGDGLCRRGFNQAEQVMAGVYGSINSRADFFAVLAKAISDGKAILALRPGDAAVKSIIGQLEAVATWTAKGRVPAQHERESVDIAVRASRELEGEREVFAWTRALYALDAYVEDWPSDEQAANATDDDFFDADE